MHALEQPKHHATTQWRETPERARQHCHIRLQLLSAEPHHHLQQELPMRSA